MFENAQIEVPGWEGAGGGYTPPIQDCFTRHAGKCAAADLEGFAHSAAAGGKSIEVEERRQGGLRQEWKSHGNVAVARVSYVSVRKMCFRAVWRTFGSTGAEREHIWGAPRDFPDITKI